MMVAPLGRSSRFAFSAAGFIATSTSGASPGVMMSWSAKWSWKLDTPGRVPAGARISAGKFGRVDRSLPNDAVSEVKRSPVSCMPSPECPANLMITRASRRTSFAPAVLRCSPTTAPSACSAGLLTWLATEPDLLEAAVRDGPPAGPPWINPTSVRVAFLESFAYWTRPRAVAACRCVPPFPLNHAGFRPPGPFHPRRGPLPHRFGPVGGNRPYGAVRPTGIARTGGPLRPAPARSGPAPAERGRGSGVQVGEHGQHPAVVAVAGGQPQLHEDVADVLLHGTVAHHQLPGDRRVRPPLGHQAQHLALPRGESREHVLLAAAPEQLGDHLRVQGRTALGHPDHRVHELTYFGHPVLEQIADAPAGTGEQFGGVPLLHVLRQH